MIEEILGYQMAHKGSAGDRVNATLAAAGYNFSQLLRWLAMILRVLIFVLARIIPSVQHA